MIHKIKKDLQKYAHPKKAAMAARFFKTGKGQYGEGDVFLGLTMLETRTVAKKYSSLSLQELQELLNSEIHEHRLTALLILAEQYKKGNMETKRKITNFYLNNTRHIDNWDLVDLTADKILGDYLLDKDSSLLQRLAKSPSLWERRIAIIATFAFIRHNRFSPTFKIAEQLLHDKQDLIHKAVGWMLREVGKRNLKAEDNFLKKYASVMPRTMLRYAIEKHSQKKRKEFMKQS